MDNFFSSPRLFDDLDKHKINSCGTAQPNRTDIPHDWTKTTETEKGWCKGEDQGRFDHINLEGQMRSLHANMDPQPAEGNFCDGNHHLMKPHILEQYICTWGKPTILIIWPTATCWVNVPSSGPQNCFFHLLDLTVLNSWIRFSSYGAKYTHQYFRLLLVRNLKLEKAKIAPPLDWLEDQVWPQQMLCNSRAAITNNIQWNHPPNSATVSVHLVARERVQCVSAPYVTSAFAWCLVSQNITQPHTVNRISEWLWQRFTNLQKCRSHIKILHIRRWNTASSIQKTKKNLVSM